MYFTPLCPSSLSYHGELEDVSELLVDSERVWLLLPLVGHVVDLPQNTLHQTSWLPHLVLQGILDLSNHVWAKKKWSLNKAKLLAYGWVYIFVFGL